VNLILSLPLLPKARLCVNRHFVSRLSLQLTLDCNSSFVSQAA
jgi:hypothetical protein